MLIYWKVAYVNKDDGRLRGRAGIVQKLLNSQGLGLDVAISSTGVDVFHDDVCLLDRPEPLYEINQSTINISNIELVLS